MQDAFETKLFAHMGEMTRTHTHTHVHARTHTHAHTHTHTHTHARACTHAFSKTITVTRRMPYNWPKAGCGAYVWFKTCISGTKIEKVCPNPLAMPLPGLATYVLVMPRYEILISR